MNLLREYIRKMLKEQAEDPVIWWDDAPKVIFMAGAPGSGKSTVIRNLGLAGRLEIINPDDQYEETMRQEEIPFDKTALLDEYRPIKTEYLAAVESGDTATISRLEPDYLRLKDIFSRNAKAFGAARTNANVKKRALEQEGDEYLVDGTGGNYNEISSQVRKLKSVGYEIAMIFIDVSLETSIERNVTRGARGGRRLADRSITRSHGAVSANKERYEELFGSNFFYVEGSEDTFEASIEAIASGVAGFLEI
jgi:predicted ABC-type ATPase